MSKRRYQSKDHDFLVLALVFFCCAFGRLRMRGFRPIRCLKNIHRPFQWNLRWRIYSESNVAKGTLSVKMLCWPS